MSGFTMETHRSLRLMGTMGELSGDMEKAVISIQNFSSRETTTIELESKPDGHSGSDERFMREFVHTVRNNIIDGETSVTKALESHYMAFAAEASRLDGGSMKELNGFRFRS